MQAATLTNAETLRVDHELGSIAPGKVADVVLVDDLVSFDVDTVIASGQVVVEDAELATELERPEYPDWTTETIDLQSKSTPEDFEVDARGNTGQVTVRTIAIQPDNYFTEEGEATLSVVDGDVRPDVENDVLKAAMLDRHEASGRVGKAFVEGYGLNEGAFGMSINSVRENIVVIGTNAEDMSDVVNRIATLQGGMVAVRDGTVEAEVQLSLFGLQSTQSAEETFERFDALSETLGDLGCDLPSPFASLEFICATPGIPSLRLSERGMVYVDTGDRPDILKSAPASDGGHVPT